MLAILNVLGSIITIIAFFRCSNRFRTWVANHIKRNAQRILIGLGVILFLVFIASNVIAFVFYSKTTRFPIPSHHQEGGFNDTTLGKLSSWHDNGDYFDASTIGNSITELEKRGFTCTEVRHVFSNDNSHETVYEVAFSESYPYPGFCLAELFYSNDYRDRVLKGSDAILIVSEGEKIKWIPSFVALPENTGISADSARKIFKENGCKRLYTWQLCSQEATEQVVIWQFPRDKRMETNESFYGYMVIGEPYDSIVIDDDGGLTFSGMYHFESEDALINWLEGN